MKSKVDIQMFKTQGSLTLGIRLSCSSPRGNLTPLQLKALQDHWQEKQD